jgi:hypothetical protein
MLMGKRPKVPEIPDDLTSLTDNGHATECRAFLDHVFQYETIKRAELERGWNRARLYDRNKQWNRRLSGQGGRLWYAWEPIVLKVGETKFPMPTRNIFSPAMQDEKARIIGVGTKPYVRIDDRDAEEAAKLGKHALLHRNETTGWDAQNAHGAYHAAMFGQWIECVDWDVSLLKTIRGPVLGAVKCARCSFALANTDVDPAQAQELRATKSFPAAIHRTVGPGGAVQDTVKECPDCGDQPMQPYDPPPAAFREGAPPDALGQPFGKDRPLGEDTTRVISPYSFFPQNQGAGYQTDLEMEEYGIRTPRTPDWVEERYEDIEGLDAEQDREKFRHHPADNTAPIYSAADGLWDGYLLYDEWYKKPCRRFPRGRVIIMAGRKLLYSGELYVEGTEIPMNDCRVAQWEPREGVIWGKPLAEDMFSVQDNINSGISQAMNMTQKWTDPKILLHEGMNLNFTGGQNSQYASDIWTVNTRGIPPEIAAKFPMEIGNKANPGTIFEMYDRDHDHVADATGARAAETGNVSGVELNYSALLFAATKSAERRKPRNMGIRALKKGIWTTRLRMIAGLYTEERQVQYQDDNNETITKKLQGIELKGQTQVTLEDEPLVDSAIAERAAIQQGLEWGTVKTSQNGGAYGCDRRINRAIGVPELLNEDNNIQDDDARDEWASYLSKGDEPMIDKQADNHAIHYETHNVAMESREARELKKAIAQQGVPWSMFLRATWEWERLFKELTASRLAIQTAPSPEQLQRTMPPAMVMEVGAKLAKAKQNLMGFPAVLELQIFDVFTRLCTAYKIDINIPELKQLARFKAHGLGHWWLATQMMAPPMGAPAGPGPGGPPAAGGPPPPAAAAPGVPGVPAGAGAGPAAAAGAA